MSFTVKYSEMGTFQFQQALTKIVNAQVAPSTAILVSQLNKQMKKAREQIAKEYITEIRDVFSTKGADGKMVESENGFEVPEDKQEEFKTAQEAFGNRTYEFNASALFPRYFEGSVKFSAEEIEALSPILVADQIPQHSATGLPIPGLRSV